MDEANLEALNCEQSGIFTLKNSMLEIKEALNCEQNGIFTLKNSMLEEVEIF